MESKEIKKGEKLGMGEAAVGTVHVGRSLSDKTKPKIGECEDRYPVGASHV